MDKKEHQFKARIPSSVWNDLEIVAQNKERSINWMVVQAIREYIARHKEHIRQQEQQAREQKSHE